MEETGKTSFMSIGVMLISAGTGTESLDTSLRITMIISGVALLFLKYKLTSNGLADSPAEKESNNAQ